MRDPRMLLGAVVVLAALLVAAIVVAATRGSGSSAPKLLVGVPLKDTRGFTSVEKAVATHSAGSVGGAPATEFDMGPGRHFFTVAQHTFLKPLDWAGRNYMYLPFRGTASGQVYGVFVDFDPSHLNSAKYVIVDTSTGWTQLALDLRTPLGGTPPFDWKHVRSVRISSVSPGDRGSFSLGALTISKG